MRFSIDLRLSPVNESIHSFWIGDFSLIEITCAEFGMAGQLAAWPWGLLFSQAVCRQKKGGPATTARPAFETVGV